MSRRTVIVYAKRTPIGKFCGALANSSAPRLGAVLVKDLLQSLPIKGEDIHEIIMGQVLTAGVGQAPARQTAIYGGLPTSVPATTINKVCGSGLKAVMLGEQAIARGDADIVIAGGQENMSQAPHLLMGSRSGFKFGPVEMRDHMQWDGLTDPYDNVAMGVCGEICAKEFKIGRAEQDEFALNSYKRSRHAIEAGYFRDEIVGVELTVKNQVSVVDRDEEPFSVDLAKIKTLRPAFDAQGTITAGNASSLSDGAAMLVLMEEELARKKGIKAIARILGSAMHAQEPTWFTTAPIEGIRKALLKTALQKNDIDLFEINEAFSVVPLIAMQKLGLSAEQVNICGGAVSLGHPIGASGARILVTLIHTLHREKKKRGVASLCIGGGESCNLVVESI